MQKYPISHQLWCVNKDNICYLSNLTIIVRCKVSFFAVLNYKMYAFLILKKIFLKHEKFYYISDIVTRIEYRIKSNAISMLVGTTYVDIPLALKRTLYCTQSQHYLPNKLELNEHGECKWR